MDPVNTAKVHGWDMWLGTNPIILFFQHPVHQITQSSKTDVVTIDLCSYILLIRAPTVSMKKIDVSIGIHQSMYRV